MDTSFLPRIGNKIPMAWVTETKFGAKMKGWTIQRLPHPGIHPIISHKTQTLLHMPARFCWKNTDIAVLCEAMPVRQIQKWMLIVIYWMEHRAPNGGARESIQRAEGICNPIGGTTLWTNQYPRALDSSCTWPLVVQTLYAPVQGNARAKKWEWVGRGVGGDLLGLHWKCKWNNYHIYI